MEKHGKSLALYADKASVLRINNKNAIGCDGFTQFGRAMHELNIQSICANTCSAKGRGKYIELWHYPDGRKEIRVYGVVLPTYDRLQEIYQGCYRGQ